MLNVVSYCNKFKIVLLVEFELSNYVVNLICSQGMKNYGPNSEWENVLYVF